jgi:murein DD-endopeptidase MepM/ murein hydrolase activator NlpD
MRGLLNFFLLSMLLTSCSTAAKKFNPYEDANTDEINSFLKVLLPIPPNTSFLISQGAFGEQSHDEPGNEYSWDFDVPYGTSVTAVADGEVIEVWEPNLGGGCDPKFSDLAHNVKVKHKDGTVAQYAHTKSLVQTGDQVRIGQKIAVTEKNGNICVPQLHFGVYKSEKHLYTSPNRRTLPLFFIGIPGGLAKTGTRQ